jgi:hypothetical protein
VGVLPVGVATVGRVQMRDSNSEKKENHFTLAPGNNHNSQLAPHS